MYEAIEHWIEYNKNKNKQYEQRRIKASMVFNTTRQE